MNDFPQYCSRFPRVLTIGLLILTGALVSGAPQKKIANPDLTKGEGIPAGASHDWNLGATGARGWMFSGGMETSAARQIAITKVAAGSPAAGILEVGDVVLGVNGKVFAFDPRTEFGRALTTAEAGEGLLKLIRWRSGKTEEVSLKLEVMGAYGATAPFDCPKSKVILERGCEALAKRMAAGSKRENPIVRSVNALALLASGNPKYLPLVKAEAQWAAGYAGESFQTWYYGYVMMFLSEYVVATGDESVLPGLRRLALEAAEGQSIVGSWGHRFAELDGRLGGYGMMNSPGIPLTTALVMARKAGIKEPLVDQAIERSAKLVRFYIGKGAIPYGDHHPWIQTHEDNGKCGMAAVMFEQLGETKGAEFFSRMTVASHGSERDQGHTGNFFNILWAMPGVALSGANASGAWMAEFGSWYFDLARQWDGTFGHQGPPEVAGDKYQGWDCTGAYLLAYAMPLKKIMLTGKDAGATPQLDAAAAQMLVNDGRGWSISNRNAGYDQLSEDELLKLLASWSPVVRDRAAMALVRRGGDPVKALLKMLDAQELSARYGACQALAYLKGKAGATVPQLKTLLHHDDLWLRIKATEALANIGKAAMPAVPDLLERLAEGPTKEDPRGMEQRFLSFALFDTLLKNSLDGVDQVLLRKGVVAALQNEDGRARSSVGGAFRFLSYEDLKPLLPAIHEAIVKPAPSGIMFGSGVRLSGIEVLAKHRIREGMTLALQIMEIDKWGKRDRINRCLKVLGQYGGAAKEVLPQLRELEKALQAHSEAKGLQSQIDELKALIESAENATEVMKLRSLK